MVEEVDGQKCFGLEEYRQLVDLELWAYGQHTDNQFCHEEVSKLEMKSKVCEAKSTTARAVADSAGKQQKEIAELKKHKKIWQVLSVVGGVLALGAGTLVIVK